MEVIVERCAALDVHKDTIMAAVRLPGEKKGRRTEVRQFRTWTSSLRELRGWLVSHGVTEVAMEATGVYWKAPWHVLCSEPSLELLLVNAQHVKNLPGRKTDVSDAQWLASLLECGLLRGSFVPDPVMSRLRDLTRHRTKLAEERGQRDPAHPKGPRGRRHQARLGRLRRPRQGTARHDRGPHRRRA